MPAEKYLSFTFFTTLAALGGLRIGAPSVAHARRAGLAIEGCDGCHRGGTTPKVTIASDLMKVDPGGSVTLTVRIPAVNGPLGGFYLHSNGKGTFTDIAGQATRRVANSEVVHTTAKSATGGEVTWQVKWTAPAMVGGVDFDVWGVSAAGGARGGRSEDGHFRLGVSIGCNGADAYLDQDKDGFGLDDERGLTRVCELGPGFATKGGDCNDNSPAVFPGAPEICDGYDNNCDGKVNEGLPNVTVYRDYDGDGHGQKGTTDTRTWCGAGLGYAPIADDCDDNDKAIHPGVMEICGNGKDDDCNGRVDDGTAFCGVGWCRRKATTCDPRSCVPGPPMPEACNGLDDDCDDKIDNGVGLCPADRMCTFGQCLTKGEAADAAIAAAMRPDAAVDTRVDPVAPIPPVATGGASGKGGVTGATAPGLPGAGGAGGASGGAPRSAGPDAGGARLHTSPSGCVVGSGLGRQGGGSLLVGLVGLVGILRVAARRRGQRRG